MYMTIFNYLQKIKLEFIVQKASREYTVLKTYFEKENKIFSVSLLGYF